MRTILAPLFPMVATLGVALALDSLTKRLLLVGYGAQMLYGLLAVDIVFAVAILLLTQIVLKTEARPRAVPIIFIVTGLLILFLATPAFTIGLASLPPDFPLRGIFHTPPLFPIAATQRLVEAAAFILTIGVFSLLPRHPRH